MRYAFPSLSGFVETGDGVGGFGWIPDERRKSLDE